MNTNICSYDKKMKSIISHLKEIYRDAPEEIIDQYLGVFSVFNMIEEKSFINPKILTFIPNEGRVSRWNEDVFLTKTESKIFNILLQRMGKTVSVKTLMVIIYENNIEEEPEEKIIEVFICHINKKIRKLNMAISRILGEGVRLKIGTSSNNIKTNHNMIYEINGCSKTIKEWLVENNISQNTFWTRIKNYQWPIEKALTTPKLEQKIKISKEFTIGDKTQTLSEWCKEKNIRPKLATQRIFYYGWDIERALSQPLDKGNMSRYNRWGKTSGSIYVDPSSKKEKRCRKILPIIEDHIKKMKPQEFSLYIKD